MNQPESLQSLSEQLRKFINLGPQAADARAAYRLALEKSDKKDSAFRAGVQLRLDALGG